MTRGLRRTEAVRQCKQLKPVHIHVVYTGLITEPSEVGSCFILQFVTHSKDVERPQIETGRFTLRIELQNGMTDTKRQIDSGFCHMDSATACRMTRGLRRTEGKDCGSKPAMTRCLQRTEGWGFKINPY